MVGNCVVEYPARQSQFVHRLTASYYKIYVYIYVILWIGFSHSIVLCSTMWSSGVNIFLDRETVKLKRFPDHVLEGGSNITSHLQLGQYKWVISSEMLLFQSNGILMFSDGALLHARIFTLAFHESIICSVGKPWTLSAFFFPFDIYI